MHNYILLIAIAFFSISANAQFVKDEKILSKDQKIVCNQDEINRRVKELDIYSNQFSDITSKIIEAAKQNPDQKKLKEYGESLRPRMLELVENLSKGRTYLKNNCGFEYKSPKARQMQELLNTDKKPSEKYSPKDAY
ncbi:MAG: hypothetical protein SFT90_02585 [Rickettsiales bacterium]|nr:hypothetical protein [Rickettsiales bacterium]